MADWHIPPMRKVLLKARDKTGIPLSELEQVSYADDGLTKPIGKHTRCESTIAERVRRIAATGTAFRFADLVDEIQGTT